MAPAWLTIIAWISVSIGLLSAVLIVADVYLLGYREHVKIMEAVWPLTALYAGPLAIAAYFWWGRPLSHKWMKEHHRGMPGKPQWALAAIHATHCSAGCVLGELMAEWIVFATALALAGFTIPADYPLSYILCLIWGILFEYFVIVSLRRPPVREGLNLAAKAEFPTVTAFEIGMLGWMAITQLVLFRSPPLATSTAAFWFLTQIAMLIGFVATYPVNWWLVRHGVKEDIS